MIKFFIGPMTKNVVDSILEFIQETGNQIGIIPSRRQVEFNGGYVNNWTTKQLREYCSNIFIVRDHAGPNQGQISDDGYESLLEDCKYFDLIHIDPWKKFQDLQSGIDETIKMIEFCYNQNPNIFFEVGTEQSIRHFSTEELEELVIQLRNRLDIDIYSNIKYLVIQSGTSLKANQNTGQYDKNRLFEMVSLCKKYNLISKEHNGDYIPIELVREKFELGLDTINIAPEFGLIETQTYLDYLKNNNFDNLIEKFFDICYKSNKWVKWVDSDFIPELNKEELIMICGHYVLSDSEFLTEIKSKCFDIDTKIKDNIRKKLNRLYGQ